MEAKAIYYGIGMGEQTRQAAERGTLTQTNGGWRGSGHRMGKDLVEIRVISKLVWPGESRRKMH